MLYNNFEELTEFKWLDFSQGFKISEILVTQ